MAAIGDALGWPTEFGHRRNVKTFCSWKKVIGGKYWGFKQEIKEGAYSDDTQLLLSTARSIRLNGKFDVESFAYEELPLWLAYEQGGGAATKQSAHRFAAGANWFDNFTSDRSRNKFRYVEAGGNGAMMRIMPIVLASWQDVQRMIIDVFQNTICTHGHIRAILGSIGYAYFLRSVIQHQRLDLATISEVLNNLQEQSFEFLDLDHRLRSWKEKWQRINNQAFSHAWLNAVRECQSLFGNIKILNQGDFEFYKINGALERATRGAGTVSLATAIGMAYKYQSDPAQGLLKIVNLLGSDTDTLANLAGAIWGLLYGLNAIPDQFKSNLQDAKYISKISLSLFETVYTKSNNVVTEEDFNRRDSLLRSLAWEIGLHDMFWDALSQGSRVAHPILGSGTIEQKSRPSVLDQKGYSAQIVKINFDVGQSCWFRSLVKDDGTIVASLGKEMRQALKKIENQQNSLIL